jgi:hypothetical protein
MSFFSFFFFYTKSENRRAKQVLPDWYEWEGEGGGEIVKKGEYVCKYYIHTYVIGKMRFAESVPSMKVGREKGGLWRG